MHTSPKRRRRAVPARFVLKEGTGGEYQYDVAVANGASAPTSEAYGSRAGAVEGIGSVGESASEAGLDDETVEGT